MGKILPREKMDKIDLGKITEELLEETYNYDKNIIYFPIRHHSPACSFHLKKVIEEYKPQIILIEGPSDSNFIIEHLINEDSITPLAIYYSYSDKEKVLSDKQAKYMCYYPFLDYSPEYNALKLGQQLKIPTEFIDLPYPSILLNTTSELNHGGEINKKEYNNDYLIERSQFIKRVCEKSNCRNFSEFFEKYYEIQGINMSTKSFIRSMLGFCISSRIGYSEELLYAEGCLSREIFMAEKIANASINYKKILVVAGGFHIYGLHNLSNNHKELSKKVKYHKFKEDNIGVYPVSYSFKESDQLNGYLSGMPFPAFYQEVWEQIAKGEERPYEKSVLNFIVESKRTVTDKIEAYNMTRGLATLRDKSQMGVYELIDAVKTCYVKGELNPSENEVLDELKKALTGNKIGNLHECEIIPPIVKDFRTLCESYRIKINTTISQEVTLDIYKNKKHSGISKFLYTLSFLEINFCNILQGPDFIQRKNTNLIRETWKYAWSSNVESSLIDISVYGATIKEAAIELCSKRLSDIENSSKDASIIIVKAYLMGIEDKVTILKDKIWHILSMDESFISTAYCAYNLQLLSSSKGCNLEKVEDIIDYSFEKAVSRIFTLNSINENTEDSVINELKNLYTLVVNGNSQEKEVAFVDSLLNLIEEECNPVIEGAVLGILKGLGVISDEKILKRAKGYFFGSGEKLIMSARFMKGLFYTSREVLFYDKEFIKGIDHFIKNLDSENFLNLLPDMRICFSYFSPSEIEQISGKVSMIYNKDDTLILEDEGIEPKVLTLGIDADSYAVEVLKRWGLYDT